MGVVAAMWVITGLLLFVTDKRTKTRLSLREFGFMGAAIVGIAQAAAIMPGISRSGATICAAILIGLHRRWAVEYSFLIAIPAIVGATLVESIGQIRNGGFGHVEPLPTLVGTISAALVGVAALKLLIRVSRSSKLKYFGFYCWALAAVVAVWLMTKG